VIVSFSVENFRSFHEAQTLNLFASNDFPGHHDGHTLPLPNRSERLLRAAVLYGANGAGKSNLVKALAYLEQLACETRQKGTGTGRQRFAFAGTASDPSVFDLQFLADGKLYRYGCKVDDERVLHEWLTGTDPDHDLFERRTDPKGRVTVTVEPTASEKLKALAIVGAPKNQSFLASIGANLSPADISPEFQAVLDWFDVCLEIITPETWFSQMGFRLEADPAFKAFAGGFLRDTGTGAAGLDVERTELPERQFRARLWPYEGDRLDQAIRAAEDVHFYVPEGNLAAVFEGGQHRFYLDRVWVEHQAVQGDKARLALTDESDGTQRLLHLVPVCEPEEPGGKSRGQVFVIDEIDRSLHPLLTRKFLAFFFAACKGVNRQILVTTHEANLLDLNLLRRDEIWFSEKDPAGATRLYSLSDFPMRDDTHVSEQYLRGRYGAIPFLGNLDRLRVPTPTRSVPDKAPEP
jgi:energy-coupling factor transporter ATP-binding protein EcfA2